eukprot:8992931-Pyramimonas_sp.AAC.1
MGAPGYFARAIQRLHSNARISISHRGMHPNIGFSRGIKQGCPVSGSPFALVVGPALRKICLLLPRP